jgi:hypothetical protein
MGQASRHSRNVFTTIGPIGMVRSLDSDLGAPIVLYRSARCLTCSSPRKPRSSEALSPVKTTVMSNARHLPVAASISRLCSQS